MKCYTIIILWLLLQACSPAPNVVEYSEEYSNQGHTPIYIVNHGWHAGLVIPAAPIKAALPELGNRFGNVDYIEFGWGDKGFYQAKEITIGLTLKALFLPTESVMHVVAVPIPTEQYFYSSDIDKLLLNDAELSSLVKFIAGSFAKDTHNQLLPLRRGIYGDSQFYKGVGTYYLINTCNSWIAKGLASIGMDIQPTISLTSSSIMNYLAAYKLAQIE